MSLAALTPEARSAALSMVRAELWRRGDLGFLLHDGQREIRDAIYSSTGRYVMEIARRWGKTWLLVVLSFEACLRSPRSRVVYGAPTLKHLAEFILPVVDSVSMECPPEHRPVWNSESGHLTFPNGSWVHLFGADDKRKANRGRGSEAVLAIFDEAGFTPVLRHVLRSVFRPSLLHTGGRIILGSTPAEEPDHEFTELATKAEAAGNYARRTVWQNPRLTTEQVETFIADDARDEGVSVEEYQQSDEFRREYLAERVVDKLLLVVPEWEAARATCIANIPRPTYFDAYTWLDFGGADPHAVLFAFYDFRRAKVVVEDELLLKDDCTTSMLAAAIKSKEQQLWGTDRWGGTIRGAQDQSFYDSLPQWALASLDKDCPEQPYQRWGDNNLALMRDLYTLHGLSVAPTAKDDKALQVNNLRVSITSGGFELRPNCVHLDRHLRTTTWDGHRRRTYKRIGGEHGDLLDCAVYGVRNLSTRNPEPKPLGPQAGFRSHLEPEESIGAMLMGDSPLARRLRKRR